MSQDKNEAVRAVIDEALTQLITLGMTPESAAYLLVVQGAIRIETPTKRAEMAEFVASLQNQQ